MGEVAACDPPAISKSGAFRSIASACGDDKVSPCGTGITPSWLDPHWLAGSLAALADSHQVPGAQLAVHHAGVTVAAEYGELEYGTGSPVTRHTAFPVGSICKVATATLAMILVGDGDLELDAPLATHVPELGELGDRLTLCHLLSHTSGYASSPDVVERSAPSLGRYVQKHCRPQDLIVPPGTTFTYSNRNYVLVGHLIETITGMSWSEAMESILLRPLGIEATMIGTGERARRGRPVATGHSVNAAVGRTRPVEQPEAPSEAPGVGLGMSASDLVALGLMHVGPGFPELLQVTYAEQMRQAIPGVEPFGLADGWGAGLAIYEGETATWVGHDGNGNGTSCHLRIDAANGSVVALTTSANAGSSLWQELRNWLGLASSQLSRRRAVPLPPEGIDAAELVGSYSNGPTEFLIRLGDDRDLLLDIGGEPVARLAFYDDLEFFIQDPISRQGHHVGRFLRDPITKQIELVQIGGRLAPRQGLPVPEARSPIESLREVLA
jgi:CubicO group peptidase (beta-lactamase class C family)